MLNACEYVYCEYYDSEYACDTCKLNPANMRSPSKTEMRNAISLLDTFRKAGQLIQSRNIVRAGDGESSERKSTGRKFDMDFEDF
jgi:hypothetical protein